MMKSRVQDVDRYVSLQVEMFSVTANRTGGESDDTLNDFADIQRHLFEQLGLHFRLLSLQGGPKKTAPNFSCNNFGKYGPILIMFSLLHSQMN